VFVTKTMELYEARESATVFTRRRDEGISAARE
jgi:hypothetical protein